MKRATGRRATALLPAVAAVALAGSPAEGQWTNRYPKIEGYSHHVYLEGYELPLLTIGPVDPAPAPDGERIAFASRGWIWVMDLETGAARRLTAGAGMDSRPAWSPDGRTLAFVRDDGNDTWIVVLNVDSGEEVTVIDTPAIDLDPVFSSDGGEIVYSSAELGALDLWAHDLASGGRRLLVGERGIELRPQVAGERLVYLAKGGGDRIMLRRGGLAEPARDTAAPPGDTAAPTRGEILIRGAITSMTRPALSPDGSLIAYSWPTEDGWELRLMLVDDPGFTVSLVEHHYPLTPAWSPDGEWIYFSEPDDRERMELKRTRVAGGPVDRVPVRSWDWGEPTARVRVRTTMAGADGLVPARLNVLDRNGHPVIPDETASHFDGQSGRVFFYSSGSVTLTVPAGRLEVSAVQGLSTPEVTRSVEAAPGTITGIDLALEPVWDPRAAGWTSGDHHFHLNYGGPYDLEPTDLVLKMRGENLDVATPLLANLHTRYGDQELWRWEKSDAAPLIRFGQEVRSHFLGHMGLIEIDELHWPWVWGPGYEVYGRDDRTNAEVLDFAHAQGGLGYYVHPVSVETPFTPAGLGRLPVELVADGVLGDMDALEIVCLWSNSIGTAAVWYRLLNLGIPIAPSAGTDVMTDFYRTMAVGTTRVYARTGDRVDWPAYVAALGEGRSFVTNGPLPDFRIGGAGPGEVVAADSADWELDLRSAVPVERVELLVNGQVVWADSGLAAPGERRYQGRAGLPSGGWVAVRALGGETVWPSMHHYTFAHTAPVWIGERGSTDPEARRAAAAELLEALVVARERLVAGYGETPIPKLTARFDEARARLEEILAGG